MILRALVLAVAALAIQAPAALAGSASVVAGTLTYTAAAGEANQLDVSYRDSDGVYFVTDAAGVSAGPGCTQESGTAASCAGSSVTGVAIDLGDGADKGSAGPFKVPMVMHGGPGNDDLSGGGTFFGDAGDDYLIGGDKADVFTGGPGLDSIEAQREDTIDCQGGEDDVVKPFAKPALENCPAAPSLAVSTNHVSVKQLLAGKLKITIRCSIRCAYRFMLIAPPKLHLHHSGSNLEARPISLDLGGFLKLGPTTQLTSAFVNGPSTRKSLARLHRFKLSLVVQAYSGQNRESTRTIPVQIG
jgi:hypothetical protein